MSEISLTGVAKREWLEYWGYANGTKEAEAAWLHKIQHDEKVAAIMNPNKPHGRMYDLPSYQSPITGKWIDGRTARKRDLQEHGCVEYEPSMKEEHAKSVIAKEAAIEKIIDETVEQQIAEMPTRKREKLISELENGADITVSRE